MKTTTTFKSQQTNKTWKIFHSTNCKTEYAIYLMECIICNLQYDGKSETPFNIRLNNHRKNVKDPKAILADKRVQKMVINGHKREIYDNKQIDKHKPLQRNLKATSYSKRKLLDTKIRNSLS